MLKDIEIKTQPMVAASAVRLYDRYVEVMMASGTLTTMNFTDFWNQLNVRGQIEYAKQLAPLEAKLNITEGVPK